MKLQLANSLQESLRRMRIDWRDPQTRILVGLMAPTIMTGMGLHMLNVALPDLREHFAIDADTTAWVLMSYTLPFMAFMPLYGRLGDGLGKKRLLLGGTVLFLAGTILVMLAPSLPWLILGRFIQGMGTAGFVPLCIAIISQRFDVQDRGRVLGTWNSAIPLSGLIFPYLAGLLVDAYGWRAIFPPLIVVTIVTFVIISRNIQPLSGNRGLGLLRSFDWTGVVLLSAALASLLFYTSSRPITGVPALQDWRLLALCVSLFLVLYFWEKRLADPYLNLGVFKNRTFTVASLSAGIRMSLMSPVMFILPLYLNDIHEVNASLIGIVLSLQAGMLFLVSRAGGQLADRWGSRPPVVISMAGLVVIMVLLALLPPATPVWVIMLVAMAHGFIVGLSLAPLHRAAMQRSGKGQEGAAAGVYSMIRFAGQIMGTAMAGVLLQRGLDRMAAPIDAYQMVFWVFAGAAVLATLTAWQIRDD